MNKLARAIASVMHRVPGEVYLLLAVVILGAASPVTRKLTQLGEQSFVGGENPISFCNVLFAGNACALAVFLVLFGRQINLRLFKSFSGKDWGAMVAVGVLSGALAPGVIFEALSRTQVNNVILIGRIELLFTLGLSIWVLGERIPREKIIGALVSFSGVVLMVVLQQVLAGGTGEDMGAPWGEILAAVGAIALALSNILSKARLSGIPLGFFSIIRTALGTVIFYFAAIYLYGSDHFMGLLTPFLWRWMLVYGTVIVVMGQSFWFAGLRDTSGAAASVAIALNPIAGIVAAYLILGEVPTTAQYIGGSIVIIGIVISQLRKEPPEPSHPRSQEQNVGFKGI